MKRFAIIVLAGLLSLPVRAYPTEHIYVSTDRSVYIAGDEIWCSLFCMDASTGRLSHYSAVAYLELVSEDTTVETAKVGLMEGRGAGKFRIPLSTPTGNYKLLAYTAGNPEGFLPGAKLVSVFNTTSIARVPDGVKLVPEQEYLAVKARFSPSDGVLDLSVGNNTRSGQTFTLGLKNNAERADFSLSVYAVDEIREPSAGSLARFLGELSQEGKSADGRLPEYEGEIVYAAVEGLNKWEADSLADMAVATLSSAGSPSDVYVGKVGENGRLMFFTNNIYGDRELVCEVSHDAGYISLVDPFRYPSVEGIEALELSPAQYGALVRRKAAKDVMAQVDTLVDFLPRRQDVLLDMLPRKRYHLDDYTRFPSLQETMVEILGELRIRTVFGKRQIQLIVPDAVNSRKVEKDHILVMLDGVVISDVSLLEGMDAMLLEDVDIYSQGIILGGISFNGVVNFITRKNYVKALQFPSNVRVVDFKGVSYPVAYLGAPVNGADYRTLLYWHPALKMESGESLSIRLTAPAYSGKFKVVAEGLTLSGKPLREEYYFEVK